MRWINRRRAALVGFILIVLLFSVAFLADDQYTSPTGFVVMEQGMKVSTAKLDSALIQEIQTGNYAPEVVVMLEEEGSQEGVLESLEENFAVSHQFNGVNALSGKINQPEALLELTENEEVKKILLDYPLEVSLDGSVPKINANDVWEISVNGVDVDGTGETVCIIDTGIDYTHPALGGCDPVTYELAGGVEELAEVVENDHPYANDFDYIWTITKPGYENIAVHFTNISLEAPSGAGDTLDRVYVYDANNQILAVYKDSLEDVWSPHGEGDTIYVRLVTDPSITDYGFQIDQVVNGTTAASMDWSSCSKVVGGWDGYNNDFDPKDDHGHGTHVAGIVASENETYRGVAPGANLVAIKAVSASGSGYSSDVLAGIDWCNTNAERLGISVISMSLGCSGGSCVHYQDHCNDDLLAEVINNSYQQNIPVFISSGNGGWTDGITNPACIEWAIPVGGVDDSDNIAYNRGNLLKLLAPANDIKSSILFGGWASLSGTSMSTPHAAGAAALFKQYWKLAYDLVPTPSQLEDKFALTGVMVDDSTGSGNNYSRIDVLAALANEGLPGLEISSPQEGAYYNQDFFLNGTAVSNNLTVIGYNFTNSLGEAMLEFFNDSWEGVFSVEELISVDSFADGEYTFVIYVKDAAGNEFATSRTCTIDTTAPVIVSISHTPELIYEGDSVTIEANISEENLDTIYLTSDVSGELVNYTMTLGDDGLFTYSFENLTIGTFSYQVSASDLASNEISSELFNFTVNLPEEVSYSAEITSPENESVVEVGEDVSFSGITDLVNATYTWDFGDETTASEQETTKSYEETGSYAVTFTATEGENSALAEIVLEVDDTLPPTVDSISYLDELHLERDGSVLAVEVVISDYSGISDFTLTFADLVQEASCTTTESCSWSLGNLTEGEYGFAIDAADNFDPVNAEQFNYTFEVTSCSDGEENGDEDGVDCAGSCDEECEEEEEESSTGSSSSNTGAASSTGGAAGGAPSAPSSPPPEPVEEPPVEEVVEESVGEVVEEPVEELAEGEEIIIEEEESKSGLAAITGATVGFATKNWWLSALVVMGMLGVVTFLVLRKKMHFRFRFKKDDDQEGLLNISKK